MRWDALINVSFPSFILFLSVFTGLIWPDFVVLLIDGVGRMYVSR